MTNARHSDHEWNQEQKRKALAESARRERHIDAADVKRVVILERTLDYKKGGAILPGIYEVIDCTPDEVTIGVNVSKGGEKIFRHMDVDPNDKKLCHGNFAFELEDGTLKVR